MCRKFPPSKKRLARDKQFNDYKNKWGLTKYKVYIDDRRDMMYFVEKECVEGYIDIKNIYSAGSLREINSLHTLLNRFKKCNTITINENCKRVAEFSSIEELKEYLLIRKLTGL